MQKHQGTNMSNVQFTVAVDSKPTIDKFSTCLTFSASMCLISQLYESVQEVARVLEFHSLG